MIENEVLQGIITVISTVGFPIAMCLLSWYQCNTIVKENTKAIQDLKEALIGLKIK